MRFLRALTLVFSLGLCIAANSASVRASEITISAAISLKDVLNDVAKDFQKDGTGTIRFNFGSSGQLMGQIKEGAPVDLFISASPKQADELIRDGLADRKSREVVARNMLVLVVPSDAPNDHAGLRFEELANTSIKRIAIGEPRTVPAGDYAMQVLTSLKLLDAVKARLVHGTHVRQVLDYVERGEVDAGVVYLSDAMEAGDKVTIVATAETAWHRPIEYVAVVIKTSAKRDIIDRFLAILSSNPSQKKLAAGGFAPATPATTQQATSNSKSAEKR